MADIGGDKGDWSVVRSRKRKATEQEFRGQDRFQVSDGQGGVDRVEGHIRQQGSCRVYNTTTWYQHEQEGFHDNRVSNKYGGRDFFG